MSVPKLDWKSAEVRESILTVKLEGDRPKGWKASFESTVRLLGGGDWGKVTLKSSLVRVADVDSGNEAKLKHFLESAVQQANADHPVEPEPEDDRGEPEGKAPGDADAEMTHNFQSFAGDE